MAKHKMKVQTRTEEELELMRKSGVITALALKKLIESAKPGVTLLELDKIAEEEIVKHGGKPSFMTVPGYKWTTCLAVNDEVVHAIPRPITLQKGDVLSIDVGAMYQGWHTDSAWTVVVGEEGNEHKKQLLAAGEQAMWDGILSVKDGAFIGDISEAMQTIIEGNGFSVVKSLVGHGVGRSNHEDPEIPGYGKKGTGMRIKAGMTLAIEIIYTAGNGEVGQLSDGWTIASEDRSLAGLFEMSVIVTKNGAEVLTDWRKV